MKETLFAKFSLLSKDEIKMSSTGIELIRYCGSVKELRRLWEDHVNEWSKLPVEQVKELVRAKDEHKQKLELFEEWEYWDEERAAIAEYDGDLSREDAERLARESIINSTGDKEK